MYNTLIYEFAGSHYEMMIDQSSSIVIIEVPECFSKIKNRDRAEFSETFANEITKYFELKPNRLLLLEMIYDPEPHYEVVDFLPIDGLLFQKSRFNLSIEQMPSFMWD